MEEKERLRNIWRTNRGVIPYSVRVKYEIELKGAVENTYVVVW